MMDVFRCLPPSIVTVNILKPYIVVTLDFETYALGPFCSVGEIHFFANNVSFSEVVEVMVGMIISHCTSPVKQ